MSIDVSDAASLSAAFEKARALSQRVLVEQMVPGVCHRIYIAGGRLVFAVRRLPKSVRGDGQKTVQQLVDEANAAEQQTPPWLRKKPFLLDELGLACLAHSGLEPQTVLKDGQLAPLRPISTTEWGGVTDDVSQVIQCQPGHSGRQHRGAFGGGRGPYERGHHAAMARNWRSDQRA